MPNLVAGFSQSPGDITDPSAQEQLVARTLRELGHIEVVSRGNRAPWALGTSSVHSVAAAVLRAIEHDLPEVVVSPRPLRLLLALAALSPRLGAWMIRRTGAHRVFELTATAQEREREA